MNAPSTPKIVLIVEESEASESFDYALTRQGHLSIKAKNFDELDVVLKLHPHLDRALVDVSQHARMDGIEAVKRIRRTYVQLPILCMSTCVDNELRERVHEVGVNHLVEKLDLTYHRLPRVLLLQL